MVKKAISQEFLTRQTCFQSEHFEKKTRNRLAKTRKKAIFLKKIHFFCKKALTESKQVFKYGSPIEKSVEPLGVVAQFWLEHRPVTPEVASSSLVYPAIKHFSLRSAFRFFAFLPFSPT